MIIMQLSFSLFPPSPGANKTAISVSTQIPITLLILDSDSDSKMFFAWAAVSVKQIV